jgi:hypothetical protein
MEFVRVGLLVVLAMILDLATPAMGWTRVVDEFEEAVHRPPVRTTSRLPRDVTSARVNYRLQLRRRAHIVRPVRKPLSGLAANPYIRKLPSRITDPPPSPED